MSEESNPTVVIETNRGAIELEIYADKSPITAANFLELVEKDHYDGLIFHRVIEGFMIQGGGFDRDMNQKMAKKTIKNESFNQVSNETGTIAMARTNDPDSASAQFYINVVDNWGLDAQGTKAGYAVFGKVTRGMEVVRDIEKSETATEAGHPDVPVEKTVIHSVEIQ
ncbi:MAG: peptidylprolyl isomerase [Gammaproteobacteria bacterium]|nr:peptidylprolyl isomerase [Gammaproteobacteria bacterium]